MKRLALVVATLLMALAPCSIQAGMDVTYPKATFSGIIGGNTADQQGRFSIKTTSTGKFTAKVKLGPRSASLRGQFDSNFHVDDTFTFKPAPFISIDVRLIMDMTPDGERITGTVQSEVLNSGNPVPFTLYQVFKYTTKNPAPQEGRFTGLFTKIDGTSPAGNGVLAISVSKTGKVKVVGTLPDGSKISTGGGISPGGVFPIFNVLYSKRGALAGFAQFHGKDGGDTAITVGGQTDSAGLIWTRTDDNNFTGHERAVFNRYTPPASGSRVLGSLDTSNGAGTFALSGGGLAQTFTEGVTVSTTNKVSITDGTSTEALKLTIDAKTGLVTGSLTLTIGSDTAQRAVNMVVNQATNDISGFFTGSTGAGDATLDPIVP